MRINIEFKNNSLIKLKVSIISIRIKMFSVLKQIKIESAALNYYVYSYRITFLND
jgi:hypothetical protein